MARFDVYRLGGEGLLVIDCQADLLAGLNTRVVVPLLAPEEAPRPARHLNPVFDVDGAPRVMVTQMLSAVELRELGEGVGSLDGQAHVILNALDFLLTGV